MLLIFLGHLSYAQSKITTEAGLESVTVYTRGVEMNHKAKVMLPAGSSEVLIKNVAHTLDENSVRIGANANVTVLSVSFNRDYMKTKEKSKAYLLLEDSLKLLNKQLAALSNEKQSEQSVLEVLDRNGTIAGTNTTVSVAELEKMLDFYGRKQLEVKKKVTDLEEMEAACTGHIARIQQQLQEMTADKDDNRGQLVVQVMAKAAAGTDFTISYVSPNAAWNAFYDLRADNTSEPLRLAYKANITQNTGIDWQKVKLVLATGNPSRNNTAPSLATWFLWFDQGNILRSLEGSVRGVAVTSGGGRSDMQLSKSLTESYSGVNSYSIQAQPGASPDIQVRGENSLSAGAAPLIVVDGAPYGGPIASIDPNTVESMTVLKDAQSTSIYGSRGSNGVVVVKTKSKNLSSYTTPVDRELNATFNVDIPYDIASNDKPHTVSLQEYKMPATYQYYAAPKKSTEAFLTARITGYEELNLLPGTANVIFENMYIGKTALDPAITADTMSLSMGADRRIVISREKVVEQSGVKMIGGNRRQTYTYEIKVRNSKKENINLTLEDQYPIATDNDMEVELLESSSAAVNKESGMLSWSLKLAPGETKTLRLSYSVKYPKNKVLANL
jgi:TonB-dependent SusC/RagA subfamily outer membrane receptor